MSEQKNSSANNSRYREKDLHKRSAMTLVKADAVLPTGANKCPHCGAENDSESLYCEHCGAKLRDMRCPKCGAPLADGADYCERCHTYIDNSHCPFCHAHTSLDDMFCPECGSPLSGIECPVCHMVGKFGFCEACGTPLTDSARQELREAWEGKAYTETIQQISKELEQLWMIRPVSSEEQRQRLDRLEQLRQRVQSLLHQDDDEETEVVKQENNKPTVEVLKPAVKKIITEEELKQQIFDKQQALQMILDEMAMPALDNPAYARNYAMARKPPVSHLAWKCNYKHALHPSPLACACPHLGGKWIVGNGSPILEND